MRRGLIVTTLCLVAFVTWMEARAEVRAVVDRHGVYQDTRVLTMFGQNVWTARDRGTAALVLNAEGAGRGDLWPTIGTPESGLKHPWVIWSRHDGHEYSLAWSRWTPFGWAPVRWLEGTPDQLGDDLDASVDFSPTGRPFVAWWRDVDGDGEILFSVWMSGWFPAFRISVEGVDSRLPRVDVMSEELIRVTYVTADGYVEQNIWFTEPATITDDINPLDHFWLGDAQHVEGSD